MFDWDFGAIFPHVFCTLCDTWRRLKLPCERGWVQLLGICFMTVDEASTVLKGMSEADQQCCYGDDCARTAVAVSSKGSDQTMVEELMRLFGQTLYHLPASSVNVEKLHANTQILCSCRGPGRKPQTIQQNTYIMSCCHEHKNFQEPLLAEVNGHTKRTSSKLLSSRLASNTMPAKAVTGFRKRKDTSTSSTSNVAILTWQTTLPFMVLTSFN